MTILTPTFHEQNGAAGQPHIVAPHEPTREGEQPVLPQAASAPGVAPVPVSGPLKVALIGTAPSSRMLAPFNDPSWQIWACSPGNMGGLPRVDVWFELHSNLLWPEHIQYGQPYIDWLKQQTFPIYMQNQSLVPNAITFPWYDMVQEFGRDFFTSSFAWMMAFAMHKGAAEIALYGIDMASRDEYIRQRPGFYYFKRRAEERGVRVSAPHESDIMQPPSLYAYCDSTPQGRKLMARRQEVSGRVNASDQQISQHTHQKTYLQGALEDIDYQESIWGGVSTDLMIAEEKITRLEAEKAQLMAQMMQLQMQHQQYQVMVSTKYAEAKADMDAGVFLPNPLMPQDWAQFAASMKPESGPVEPPRRRRRQRVVAEPETSAPE